MSGFISPAFRAEVHANLRLALPLIAAQLAAVGMGTIDNFYAGRIGPQALAAVGVAVQAYNVFLIFFMGLLMACSPITAQMFGARRPAAEIGQFLRRSRRFALAVGLCWTVSINLAGPPVLRRLGLPAATAEEAVGFLHWLSIAGIGTSLWFSLRFGAEGLGQVWPIVLAGTTGLAANALFGWLFVFGHLGLPRLGIKGLGLATSLATAVMAGMLALQYRLLPSLRIYAVPRALRMLPGEGAPDILRLGLPIALIVTAEGGLFVLTGLLMARFGEAVVASYLVAINFASLAFMIPLGVGMATTVRVGQAMGAGEVAAARARGFVGIRLGGLNSASNAAIMLLFTAPLIALITEDPGVAAQAGTFLWLAAAFQLFDGLQAAANGALRGLKDTRVPVLITLASYWGIGLPVAWLLAFGLGLGPDGLWWGLTAGLGMAALGLSLRFHYKSRKTLRRAQEMEITKSHNSMPIRS